MSHEPDPPAPPAPMIFHLDDKRVADADAEEHGSAYDDSVEIHITPSLFPGKVRQI